MVAELGLAGNGVEGNGVCENAGDKQWVVGRVAVEWEEAVGISSWEDDVLEGSVGVRCRTWIEEGEVIEGDNSVRKW